MKPNLIELRKMLEHSKREGVKMHAWIQKPWSEIDAGHGCGTIGCLCGTYVVHEKLDVFKNWSFDLRYELLATHLGLSSMQFAWLFYSRPSVKFRYRKLDEVTTKQACLRLQRFIEFHERQNAMAEQQVFTRQIENQNHMLELATAI